MISTYLPLLILLAGIGTLILALVSIAIPFLLKWKEELRVVKPLIRNIFYTYAVYILSINTWFGILSICCNQELSSRSPLATGVTVFIALYWLGRVLTQFTFSKAQGRPSGILFLLGEIALCTLFIFFSITYSIAALYNLGYL